MNALIEKFKQYGPLSNEIEKELLKKIKMQTRPKGDFFLKQGQVITCLFMLETGLVRSYYTVEDREVNSWFGFENIILGSITPLFLQRPSSENIQFLEHSTIHYIESSDLEALYRKHTEMNTIGRLIAEECCKFLEERVNSLQTQSAEKRYQSLLSFQPDALQRISLGHIASYLGIKQETLSRIRKK
ncbi:CRP-like cAMP-binding protein [Flavobacterium sp. HSC-32F16]|uniref:Crp/Fnr family transcriptional regulator n=1 Tax=Flavobacterium sp. HSC-32F16 TaxID=2910964 RepID=UPI0020A282BD|nr:Crp/Fnr family transcriptional regulator [Flavobacterium sp. HSC-32F16]MCP2025174.1 CRP-like cAMP-binding protein [Flavobacterium sp. HSC-32F16]